MENMNALASFARLVATLVALVIVIGGIGGYIVWKRSQLKGDN